MKWLLILIIQVLASENEKIVNIINRERKQFDLDEIHYNEKLHNELQDIRSEINDDSWWYGTSNITSSFTYTNPETNETFVRTNFLNGSHLKLKYGKYIYRDTMKYSALKIVRFRVNQIGCFDWSMCNKETYNVFTSCMKNPIIFKNSLKCSWAYAYTPFHLLKSLKSIAVLRLNTQGIYVPNSLKNVQKRAFFIYGDYGNITSDYPFTN